MYLILIFLMSLSVMAQKDDPRKDKLHACAEDFPKFCKEAIPGDHNRWACLGTNMHLLSKSCQKFMEGVYLRQLECGKDILTYCRGPQKNYGKWQQCLAEKKESLSGKCDEVVSKEIKGQTLFKEIYALCLDERRKYCNDLPEIQCIFKILSTPEKSLSQNCRLKVTELKAFLKSSR